MIIVLSKNGHDCVMTKEQAAVQENLTGTQLIVTDLKAYVLEQMENGMLFYENLGVGEKIELGRPLTWQDIQEMPVIEDRPMAALFPMAGG